MYELEKQFAQDRLKCNLEQENLEQYQKERNAKDLQNKVDDSFHGTSVKRLGCWLNQKNSLSAATDSFHKQMNKFTKRESKCKNDEHREKLNKENERIYQEVSWDHTVQIGLE